MSRGIREQKYWQRNLSRFCSALLFAVLCAALCGGVRAESTVRIGGTGSALGVMTLLGKAYAKTHPGVSITVVPSLGSGGSIAALEQGALDLAISSRPLNADETGAAQAVEFARTPFVFAVHNKVPKTDVTIRELVDIFEGRTANWSDGTQIRLILRPTSETDTQLVKQLSPALDRAVQLAHARPGMTIAITDQECANAIAKVPGALAGITLTQVVTEKRSVKTLSFNGVKPTLQNLANGSYAPVRTFYLVTSTNTSATAQQFANFISSPKARAILTEAGNLYISDGKER